MDEAGAGLRGALVSGPGTRVIRLLLNPTGTEFTPWLESVKIATPEIRGMMVQRLFARVFVGAGFHTVVGKEWDIFARNPLRSLLIEIKSSLEGGRFGSRAILTQLDGYMTASQRRSAEIWLGVMGIRRPVSLQSTFRTEMRNRNIGLIEIRWISPRETLLFHIPSIL